MHLVRVAWRPAAFAVLTKVHMWHVCITGTKNCCIVLKYTVDPGRVFDRTAGLDELPDG